MSLVGEFTAKASQGITDHLFVVFWYQAKNQIQITTGLLVRIRPWVEESEKKFSDFKIDLVNGESVGNKQVQCDQYS